MIVHERVVRLRPDLTEEDVLSAWKNILSSFTRTWTGQRECVAVGVDNNGRLIEMIALRTENGSMLIYHALTPPTKKVLKEMRMV